MLPTDNHFIAELAFRLCTQAGHSWQYNRRTRADWEATTRAVVREANKVVEWQKEYRARKSSESAEGKKLAETAEAAKPTTPTKPTKPTKTAKAAKPTTPTKAAKSKPKKKD